MRRGNWCQMSSRVRKSEPCFGRVAPPPDRGYRSPVSVVARRLGAVVVACTLFACEGYVRHGSALYGDGRYIEAAEVFERTEHRLGEYTPREKAEYGLYRGMTLLVLGDLGNARRWMAYSYEVERANPGTLRADRRALLDRGWFELGQRQRGEVETRPLAPSTAIASRQPAQPDARPSEPSRTEERSLIKR